MLHKKQIKTWTLSRLSSLFDPIVVAVLSANVKRECTFLDLLLKSKRKICQSLSGLSFLIYQSTSLEKSLAWVGGSSAFPVPNAPIKERGCCWMPSSGHFLRSVFSKIASLAREMQKSRLSRQKGTNFERELSSMRKETPTDQADRQNTAFCSLTTDDIAHNCKNENSLSDHFLLLKPFDSL